MSDYGERKRYIQRGMRLPLLAAALTLAMVGSGLMAAANPAAAADYPRVDTWDYPADLHDPLITSLGQSFVVEATDVDTVGGVFANYNQSGSGFTMSLRSGDAAGAIIASETFTDIRDNVWVELELDSPLEPGTYYLEATDPVGLVAWWSNRSNLYPDGEAFVDGNAVSGDRTFLVRNGAPVVVPPPVSQPGFTNGVADGMTFDSEGMTIRRDDRSGFSYDYAPSVIVEDGLERAWWCGHNVNGDGVYYAERTVGAEEWTEPSLVLRADQPWEVVHVCDPSVIRGDFSVDGTAYRYLMMYGAADLSGQNTKLGTAFSNDGVSWTKHPDHALLEEPGMIWDYGVGMPALFSQDGDIYVAYFDTGDNSAPIVRAVGADGSLGAERVMLPQSGGDTFADVAYSASENVWYLATKSQLNGIADEETYVYKSLSADLASTEWVYLGIVSEWLTGWARNHNAGWYRNADGSLYEEGGVKRLMFGAQDGGSGTFDADKWDLATVAISGTPSASEQPGGFDLHGPDGEIDPLDVNSFAWSASAGATSYTLRVGEDRSLSSSTLALSTTVHSTSVGEMATAFTTGSGTQRMALDPGKTYYWSVTAANPEGAVQASEVKSFTTSPGYDLDLTGHHVGWRTLGNAAFTHGSPATLALPDAQSALQTGADYSPTRILLRDADAMRFTFDEGSDPAAVGDLVVKYRLQSDPRSTPEHVKSVSVAESLVGDELVIDMTGMPGWGEDARIAQLTIGATAPGTLSLRGIEVFGHVPPDSETSAPGVASISTTSGRDDGLHDGDHDVLVNLWWGTNASLVRLFENGVLIDEVPLTLNSPHAQSVSIPVRDRPNGEYVYTAELVNSQGATPTKSVTVKVTDANPAKPVLSHDNWDGDSRYVVTGNLWWGTNATSWSLLEDGVVVAEGALTADTPNAQRVQVPLTDRSVGTHQYVLEFRNARGATSSDALTVSVKAAGAVVHGRS